MSEDKPVRRTLPKSISDLIPKVSSRERKLGRWLKGPVTHMPDEPTTNDTTVNWPEADPTATGWVWIGEWREGQYVPVTLIMHRSEGITTDDLRLLSLPGALHELGKGVTFTEPGVFREDWPVTSSDRDHTFIAVPPEFGTKVRPIPDDHLRFTGQVFELAVSRGHSPYQYLARLLDSSDVTALNWCKRAWEAGYIESRSFGSDD